MRISPSYLALAGCVVVGGYLLVGDGDDEASAQPAPVAAARPSATPAKAPRLPDVDAEPEIDVATDEAAEEEEMRGLTPLEELAELAFVFSVDGVSYVRAVQRRARARSRHRRADRGGRRVRGGRRR